MFVARAPDTKPRPQRERNTVPPKLHLDDLADGVSLLTPRNLPANGPQDAPPTVGALGWFRKRFDGERRNEHDAH